jgi:putative FmdB family regulatory protein
MLSAMPIYEYRCRACDERFEELVRNPDVVVPCPSCGDRNAERLLSVFAGVGGGGTGAAPDPSGGLGPPPMGACGPGCGCHH